MKKHYTDYIQTVFTRFGIKFANFLFFILIAKHLTLQEMGSFGIFFSSIVLVAAVSDFGLRHSLSKYIGSFDTVNITQVVNTIIIIFFIIALLVSGIFICLDKYYFEGLFSFSILIFLLATLSMTFTRISQSVFIGTKKINLLNKSDSVSRFALLLITLYLYLTGDITLNTAVIAVAIAQFSTSIFVLVYFFRSLSDFMFRDFIPKAEILRLFKTGMFFMFSVVMMIIFKRHHIFILENLSSEQAGVFFGFYRLSEIFIEISLAISIVLFSRTATNKDESLALTEAARTSRFTMLLLFPFLIFSLIFSGHLINFLYVDAYSEYKSVFLTLAIASYIGVFWAVLFPALSVLINPIYFSLNFIFATFASLMIYLYHATYSDVNALLASRIFLFANALLMILTLATLRVKMKAKISAFFIPELCELKFIFSKLKGRFK